MIRQECPAMINSKLVLEVSDKVVVVLKASMINSDKRPEVVVDNAKVIHLETFLRNSRNSLEVPVLVASNVALNVVRRQQRVRTLL